MESYIGKKVLVRAYEAGVYFGTLERFTEKIAKLTQVRNIWNWEGATCLSQIANDGIRGGRVSPTVESMIIANWCQMIPLSETAIDNLEGQREWKV